MITNTLKDKLPLVSVLMTVYNREKYIAEAIESVLASSYTNFELIIVDDGSKDRSVEIAKSYEAKDNRIKVYVNEKNLGDYPNRNKAASYAKGKYLKYVDADDMIYWYGLEVMVKNMEQFPDAAVGLCHSKPEELIPYPYELLPDEAYKEHFLGRGLFDYGPTGLIFNRELFEKENGFSNIRFLGDTEFLLRVGAKYPTVKMPPGLAWWRQHEGQEINIGNDSGFYIVKTFELNIQMLNAPTCPLPETDRKKAIFRQKQHHARKLLAMLFQNYNIKLFITAFSSSKLTFIELLRGFEPYT